MSCDACVCAKQRCDCPGEIKVPKWRRATEVPDERTTHKWVKLKKFVAPSKALDRELIMGPSWPRMTNFEECFLMEMTEMRKVVSSELRW